jgi:hypothetical protein
MPDPTPTPAEQTETPDPADEAADPVSDQTWTAVAETASTNAVLAALSADDPAWAVTDLIAASVRTAAPHLTAELAEENDRAWATARDLMTAIGLDPDTVTETSDAIRHATQLRADLVEAENRLAQIWGLVQKTAGRGERAGARPDRLELLHPDHREGLT